jgi:phage virion morphogenesis protein
MAGRLIDIEILGLQELQREIRRSFVINKVRALDEIGQYFVSEVLQRFVRSEDHDGHAWERLKYRTGKPLIDTGILRGSITHTVQENHVEVGTNVLYAAIHNYGGRAGRNNNVTIPKREYMGISHVNEKEIIEIAEKHLGSNRS